MEYRLQVIIMALAGLMAMRFGRQVVITSTFREGDKGVHGSGRGCDIRCNDWTPQELEEAEAFLQAIHYEGKAKTILVHGKGDNIHFHIQTSWRRPGILFIQERVLKVKDLFERKIETASKESDQK